MPKENILIVGDDGNIQELVQFNLVKESYRVGCSKSGEGGLNKARSSIPDLVILDLMLPGMDGLEVCRQLGEVRFIFIFLRLKTNL